MKIPPGSPSMTDDIKGFKFPFHLDGDTGSWPISQGEEKYQQNIVEILSTQVGERVMNREFGANLRRFVHEINDSSMHALIKDEIIEAIHRFEPRVTVTKINIQTSEIKGVLELHIGYLIKSTEAQNHLVMKVDETLQT